MRSLLSQLLAIGPELAVFILTSPLLSSRGAYAITQSTVPSPNLDLSKLGRVSITGDFDSVSLYTYAGQNENAFNTNGSQSLLTRYPNGAFESLGLADAYITTMCPFVQKDGSLAGVVVGGNFTSLGGVQAQGIALWNPNTTQITALPGLSGKVNSVYCDNSSGTVYVGGSFTGSNSTNAISWTTSWTNMPFEGFNGPVNSITKNAAGNIVFAGEFDGLGNTTTPKTPDGQVVNIASGNITADGTTSTAGFTDPSQIVCKTGQQDGSGNTWLLADNTAGYWQGNFSFGFNPTKMRLYNTQYQGRGTKTFYFENLNSGGILNLNYLDADGQNQSCSAVCPLPQNNSTYQDFHFVPPVGMNAFRVHITQWYGSGGGLAGMEMFQNDIYSFAVNDFNEPQCDDVSQGSNSTATPSNLWNRVNNNGQSSSDYLSASISSASQLTSGTNVLFTPDIKQSGNYSITVYTPGCLQDNSCSQRGQVNITGSMTSTTSAVTATLFQTNNYDKFDQVYFGYVDVDTDSFRPSVTLAPMPNQNVPLTVVAQRVRFELVTTTGGLNGLFEYNPNQAVVGTDFSSSAIDTAGAGLNSGAVINAVASYNKQIYAVGNFSGNGISNVMSIGTNATSLPNGGLNADVQCLYQNGSTLYMGGNFSNTADNSIQGLNNLAAFDAAGNRWTALGAGVNGTVMEIVPLSLNISTGDLEDCLTINGDFKSVNAFGSNAAFSANGFAVWVPGKSNWLHNLPNTNIALSGQLVTFTDVPGFSRLYAGQISTQALGLSGAVELVGSGQPSLQSLGVQLKPSQSGSNSSTVRKRALGQGQSVAGVYTGLYYHNTTTGVNVTVLGGRFSGTASDGSAVQNLMLINDTAAQTVTGPSGLNADSTFVAMDTHNQLLFAGGQVSGTVNNNAVNGLIVYDLAAAAYSTPQPPALTGTDLIVNAIAAQPNGANAVYVGGNFTGAGSLPCAALCYYDTSVMQWNSPGAGLTGTVNDMHWTSNTELLIAGSLSLNGNATGLVTYDSSKQAFTAFPGSADLPGPVTAVTPDSNANSYWAAGTSTSNNSAFLSKYANNAWTPVGGLGAGTVIRGLQAISLTSGHGKTALVSNNMVLMLLGNIAVPNFGNASTALFNGTAFQPFILTNKDDGSQGSASSLFVQFPANLMSAAGGERHLALGLVVLVGLAISLGLIFLLVVAGILVERQRRRREGYVPMSMDKSGNGHGNFARIPPESLLGGLEEKGSAPKL